MKSKISGSLVAFMAVLAVSALASAAASAATKCPSPGGGKVALCKGGNEVEGEFQSISRKKPSTEWRFERSEYVAIACEEAKNSGTIDAKDGATTFGKLVIELSKCKVANNKATEEDCIVSEFKTKELTGEFVGENPEEVVLKPTNGEVFADLTIKNNGLKSCSFKIDEAKITGTQEAKLPSATKELEKHELKLEPSGSRLEFLGDQASLTLTEEFELASKELFSFQAS